MELDLTTILLGIIAALGIFTVQSKKIRKLKADKSLRDAEKESDRTEEEFAEIQDDIDDLQDKIDEGNDESPSDFWDKFKRGKE